MVQGWVICGHRPLRAQPVEKAAIFFAVVVDFVCYYLATWFLPTPCHLLRIGRGAAPAACALLPQADLLPLGAEWSHSLRRSLRLTPWSFCGMTSATSTANGPGGDAATTGDSFIPLSFGQPNEYKEWRKRITLYHHKMLLAKRPGD